MDDAALVRGFERLRTCLKIGSVSLGGIGPR